ncbi:hypothetical protein HU735_03210 [Pseudomonas sp. BW16M2]|uniref:hypothetical protein n=1 Tax=Pseudomonas sp. BW16M2 TaxID=2745489 RepID=UPI001646F0B4|nr:hypothetical protein [Pseudomonas sp. BW16M2]MBC3434411.1 hypothetical protein [Pseudomonas sp. BW16M2]
MPMLNGKSVLLKHWLSSPRLLLRIVGSVLLLHGVTVDAASRFGSATIDVQGTDHVITTWSSLPIGHVDDNGQDTKVLLGQFVPPSLNKQIGTEFTAVPTRTLEMAIKAPFKMATGTGLPPVSDPMSDDFFTPFDIENYRPIFSTAVEAGDPQWINKADWTFSYPQLDKLIQELLDRTSRISGRHQITNPSSCTINPAQIQWRFSARPDFPSSLFEEYAKALQQLPLRTRVQTVSLDMTAISNNSFSSTFTSASTTSKIDIGSFSKSDLKDGLEAVRNMAFSPDCRRYLYHSGILSSKRHFFITETNDNELLLLQNSWEAAAQTIPLSPEEESGLDSAQVIAKKFEAWRQTHTTHTSADLEEFALLSGDSNTELDKHGSWIFGFTSNNTPNYTIAATSPAVRYNVQRLISSFFGYARARNSFDYDRPWATVRFLSDMTETISRNQRKVNYSREFNPEPWENRFYPRRDYIKTAASDMNMSYGSSSICVLQENGLPESACQYSAALKNEQFAKDDTKIEARARKYEEQDFALYNIVVDALLQRLQDEKIRFELLPDLLELKTSIDATIELRKRAHEIAFGSIPFRLVEVRMPKNQTIEQGAPIATIVPAFREAILVQVSPTDPLMDAIKVGSIVDVKLLKSSQPPIPFEVISATSVSGNLQASAESLNSYIGEWIKRQEYSGTVTAIAPTTSGFSIELVLECDKSQYVLGEIDEATVPPGLRDVLQKTFPTASERTSGTGFLQKKFTTRRVPDGLFTGAGELSVLVVPSGRADLAAYKNAIHQRIIGRQ